MSATVQLPPIDLAEIRREVQRRHLIAIAETDPVLAVASMIDVVSEKALARFLAALDTALDRQHRAAVEAGERIVNRGAEHLVTTVHAAVSETTASAVAAMKQSGSELPNLIGAALDEQRRLLAQTRMAALWAWIGAGGLMLAGVVAIGVIVGRLL